MTTRPRGRATKPANREEAAGRAAERAPQKQLERAFAVIDALLKSPQPMRLTDLTDVAGLDASGTLRLLKQLADLGYVSRNDSRKTYLAGARAAFPLGLFHPYQELRRDATELLMEIRHDHGTTAALQIFVRGERILLDVRHGASRLAPYWETTIRSPLHSSASGKLLLLAMERDQRRTLLGPGPFERFTEHTITDPARLEADLEDSARRGWTRANEEAYAGMSTVAAPIRSSTGSFIGAVIATGMASQFQDGRMPAIAQTVKRAAEILSAMSPAVRMLEPLLDGR